MEAQVQAQQARNSLFCGRLQVQAQQARYRRRSRRRLGEGRGVAAGGRRQTSVETGQEWTEQLTSKL